MLRARATRFRSLTTPPTTSVSPREQYRRARCAELAGHRPADGRVHVPADDESVAGPDRRRRRLRRSAIQRGVFLFDTGFGFGNAELDDYYKVRARPLPEVLAAAGVDRAEITAIANCHLHADHSGQNLLLPGLPIYVQPAEWAVAHEPRLHDPSSGSTSRAPATAQVAGDHEVGARHPHLRDPRPLARSPVARRRYAGRAAAPGRPGRVQPRRVERHRGRARGRDGRAGPAPPTNASVARLRALNPKRVLFGHDRQGWPRRPRGRAGVSLAGRARRGTSGALYLQSAPAGLNSPSRPLRSEAAAPGGVEDRVPRSGESRTVSGPEGSSTQRSSSGAAERPDLSRLLRWARASVVDGGCTATSTFGTHARERDASSPAT